MLLTLPLRHFRCFSQCMASLLRMPCRVLLLPYDTLLYFDATLFASAAMLLRQPRCSRCWSTVSHIRYGHNSRRPFMRHYAIDYRCQLTRYIDIFDTSRRRHQRRYDAASARRMSASYDIYYAADAAAAATLSVFQILPLLRLP